MTEAVEAMAVAKAATEVAAMEAVKVAEGEADRETDLVVQEDSLKV